jgi:hypothetical protein
MTLPTLSAPKFKAKLSDGRQIEYRPFVVKEEKVLLMALESGDMTAKISAVLDLVEACTFGKINVEILTLAEIVSLIIKIRTKSVGESAVFSLRCETKDCNHHHELTLDLSKVGLTKSTNTTNKIMLNDETGIMLKIPTIKDQMISDLKEMDLADRAIDLIALHIESVFTAESSTNRKDVSNEELTDFVHQLTREQIKTINDWIVSEPQLLEVIEFKCEKCGETTSVELKGFDDFFV